MTTIFAQVCSDGIVFGTHGRVNLRVSDLIISRINEDDIHLSLLGDSGVMSVLYNALVEEREHGAPVLTMLNPELQLTTESIYRCVFNNIVKYFMENYPSMVCEVYRLSGILVHVDMLAVCSGASFYPCNNPNRRFVVVGDDDDLLVPHLHYSDLMNVNSSASEYAESLKFNAAIFDQCYRSNIGQLSLNEIKRHSN